MEQLEKNREAILAASEGIEQRRSRFGSARWIAVAAPLAIAAAVALWLSLGDRSEHDDGAALISVERAPARDAAVAKDSFVKVTSRGAADFDDPGDGLDRVVELRDGEVIAEVANLATDQLFRVRARNAEISTFHAKFSAAAHRGELVAIVVYEGRIELRHGDDPSQTLAAGERWRTPTKTASAASSDQTKAATKRVQRDAIEREGENSKPKPSPAGPGETEFRRGWVALRGKKYADAAVAFDAACRASSNRALGEDACFWAAVATKRSGRSQRARRHLSRFLRRYPSSSRAGEASALLGWMLYDANQLDKAGARFRAAIGDAVPKVRESARKGLAAIKARAKPPK